MVETESDHRAVKRAFGHAAERGERLLTTNYVVVEATALLQHRIGLAPVRDLVMRILPLVDLLMVDGPLHRRAMERLYRIDRRRVSAVDASSFEAMDAEGVSEVLGLDQDFEEEGFRLRP